MPDLATLKALAQKLRRISILSTTEAGSGHPTTCMSMAEIMSVLYFDEMNWDPSHADRPGADTFVLSKGHAAPILWAALHEAGAVREDPMTLRKVTSPGTLLNPFAAVPAAFGAAGALEVDSGTHLYQLLQVAFALRNPETTTVPIANANYLTPAGDAVQWDRARASRLFNDLNTDRPVPRHLLTGSHLGA